MARTLSFMLGAIFSISFSHAANVLPPHGFDDDDTGGWTAGRPFVVPSIQPNGGPQGDGDPFLLATSNGGFGAGSILAVFNNRPEWTGDFKTPSITGMSVDLMNPETSNQLEMRLVLFGPISTNNRWTSTESVSVSTDGAWRNYFFPINETSMTSVLGNASFDDLISGAVRFMIRHDPGPPSSGGASLRAQLGIDNIALVAGLLGDYNNNGQLDAGDLDVQARGIMAGDVAFDLDADGDADVDDRVKWIHDLLRSWVGDSNFDGEFNSADFVAVFQVGKYETGQEAIYVEGDWNGDKLFDSGDFVMAFQDGGFERGPRVMSASVPEPCTRFLLAMGLLSGSTIFRRVMWN